MGNEITATSGTWTPRSLARRQKIPYLKIFNKSNGERVEPVINFFVLLFQASYARLVVSAITATASGRVSFHSPARLALPEALQSI
ncbi:hypothetical protein SAMN05216315_13219 [Nitrosospira sp. Nsp18]|nr:hypothetical protein SAMN05216315_13219 [Nitrosospira sp. Nsp18]